MALLSIDIDGPKKFAVPQDSDWRVCVVNAPGGLDAVALLVGNPTGTGTAATWPAERTAMLTRCEDGTWLGVVPAVACPAQESGVDWRVVGYAGGRRQYLARGEMDVFAWCGTGGARNFR